MHNLESDQNKQFEVIVEKGKIVDSINRLFIGTDKRDWRSVESSFADTVLLDYTSMAGSEPAQLSPQQITTVWKSILPGFDATHHQIGNYIVDLNENEADVFCYGTATHFLANENGGNIWTVVGSYDFHLVKTSEKWIVNKMKFNFKYQDGNTDLPERAKQRLTGKDNN